MTDGRAGGAGPAPTEAERLLLAGDLAAAAALIPAGAGDDPGWARLRLALALLDAGGQSWPAADEAALVPLEGRPPPDLPSLTAARPGRDAFDRAWTLERRLAQAAAERAERLLADGDAEAARGIMEQAMATLAPTAAMFGLLGRICSRLNRPTDAAAAQERAVDLAPGDRLARCALGTALLGISDAERAAASFAAGRPDPVADGPAYAARLYAMAQTEADPLELAAATRAFGAAVAPRMAPGPPSRPQPARPRVGFLWSPARRGAGYWLTDLLRHRDRDRWTALLYAIDATRRFEKSDLAALPDRVTVGTRRSGAQIAQHMREEQVDLLVSFAEHVPGGMLDVLDERPARLHAEWLEGGWPTGHPAVTHLLADRGHWAPDMTVPPGHRVVGFPGSIISGGPALATADRLGRAQPAGQRPFAFGWCGPAQRITRRTVGAWAAILQRTPGAILRLRHADWRAGGAKERVAIQFLELGVPAPRVEFDWPADQSVEALVGLWRDIDLALDSFPAGDIAATMDALAMGVPIVTIAGNRYAGRHAAAALSWVGLADLVTADDAGYVARAAGLAADPAALKAMRTAIPERMRASPLAGGPASSKAFERGIYRLLGIERGA
ncbi:hypothetical protein STVA_19840 [Allostella vacuolata]|nr:hypothetical protein STVA_19840 [Stella vacuolata]